VFFGLGGFDEFIGEGGDDIMVGSAGVGKMVGMSGFDWAIYKDNSAGTNADLFRGIAFDETPIPPANAALDVYERVEGLSGSRFNDTLRGSDEDRGRDRAGRSRPHRAAPMATGKLSRCAGHRARSPACRLSWERALPRSTRARSSSAATATTSSSGRGGNDIIDGDKWLNVRISVRQNGRRHRAGDRDGTTA
jgi:hypothetical protein